ncbi:MAG TPA: VWA domain-containing protein [Acidobacteriaceae bacterium]|jgi:VWFA-related protein
MRRGPLALIPTALILTLNGWSYAQSPQDSPTPTLKLTTREIVLDVSVSDSEGRSVRGLHQSDFVISENGKPQPIHSFAEFDQQPTPPDLPPELPPNVYTNYQPLPETGPVNILLLDTLNAQPADLAHEQEAVMDYLEKVPPGTQLAILWLSTSGLHTLQPFTSEPVLLRRAVQTRMFEFGSNMERWTRDWYTTDAIDQIAAYVSRIRGRKNLLWFTPRMPIPLVHDGGYSWPDPDSHGGWSAPDMGVVNRLMDAFELLTTEQIAVYPIDPGGVQGLGIESLRAEAVAEGLGGIAYYNNNDLGSVIARAIDNGSHFYTLSYRPPSRKDDGHFHSIKVEVNRPGLRLVYRKGYNAEDPRLHLPTSGPPLLNAALQAKVPSATQLYFNVAVQPQPASATQNPDAAGPDPTRPAQLRPAGSPVLGALARKYRKARLTRFDLVYALQPAQIAFADGPNGTHSGALEFQAAAYSSNRKLVTTLKQATTLPLSADTDPQSDDTPIFEFAQHLDLPPGRIYLRVGILDRLSNKVGTLEIPLTIPKR